MFLLVCLEGLLMEEKGLNNFLLCLGCWTGFESLLGELQVKMKVVSSRPFQNTQLK